VNVFVRGTAVLNRTVGLSREMPSGHASGVIENSRIETVLPKHGPTDGAD